MTPPGRSRSSTAAISRIGILDKAETREGGTFNATSFPLPMEGMLAAAASAAGVEIDLVRVDEDWLLDQGVVAWHGELVEKDYGPSALAHGLEPTRERELLAAWATLKAQREPLSEG